MGKKKDKEIGGRTKESYTGKRTESQVNQEFLEHLSEPLTSIFPLLSALMLVGPCEDFCSQEALQRNRFSIMQRVSKTLRDGLTLWGSSL